MKLHMHRYGYAKYIKLSTKVSEGTETERPKLVIELKRSPNFKKLMEDFNKSKETQK